MNKRLKPIKLQEITSAYYKIQYFFFDHPTKNFSLNGLCLKVKISKTTANAVVEQLVKEGFLNKEVIGKLWKISCNLRHHYNATRKISYHLSLIYESNIIGAIHEIFPNARAIILFGSYRKGDDAENSDLDIAVEVISNESPKIMELGVIPYLGYRQDIAVNLHVFSRNNISINLFANIANGIVLDGFLEVKL